MEHNSNIGQCKVSIIIPIYNVEEYLEECLECVINQTLYDIEIICVNDGSNDKCKSIIEFYAQRDDRIIQINKKNTGYGHSVNLGISISRGKYIGIVEPDDFLELEMMAELYEIAVHYDLDVIKADFDIIRGKRGEVTHSRQKICKNYDFYNRIMSSRENMSIFNASLYTWAGIYKRSFLVENNIWHHETPGASYQDNGFWFQVFTKAKAVYFVEKSYYCLRRDNPNSSIKSKEKVYCICEEYDFIRQKLLWWKEESYLPMQWYWRYKAYIGTLKRISSKYKKEFLTRFRTDFLFALANKEIDMELYEEGEKEFLENILEKNYDYVYKKMFFDEKLLQELKKCQHIILYGEENIIRDVCKRLDEYADSSIILDGVALIDGREKGMIWNQHVKSLYSLYSDMPKAAIWIATKDNCEGIKEDCRKLGYNIFLDLPNYVEGIKNA